MPTNLQHRQHTGPHRLCSNSRAQGSGPSATATMARFRGHRPGQRQALHAVEQRHHAQQPDRAARSMPGFVGRRDGHAEHVVKSPPQTPPSTKGPHQGSSPRRAGWRSRRITSRSTHRLHGPAAGGPPAPGGAAVNELGRLAGGGARVQGRLRRWGCGHGWLAVDVGWACSAGFAGAFAFVGAGVERRAGAWPLRWGLHRHAVAVRPEKWAGAAGRPRRGS